MKTYTVTITWNVPFYGYREETHTSMASYAVAQKLVDACKTSDSFVSAFISNNRK